MAYSLSQLKTFFRQAIKVVSGGPADRTRGADLITALDRVAEASVLKNDLTQSLGNAPDKAPSEKAVAAALANLGGGTAFSPFAAGDYGIPQALNSQAALNTYVLQKLQGLAPTAPVSVVPVVSITSPAAGTTVTAGQSVTLVATATDNMAVTSVQFFNALGVPLGFGVKNGNEYSLAITVPTGATGSYAITAEAKDADNNKATATVTLTVQASTTPTNPGNTTPDAPTWSFDSNLRVLTLSHPLGSSELEYSVSGGAYQAYAPLSISDDAHAAGKWKGRVKAATGRNASGTADSPAIAAKATSPVVTNMSPASGPIGTVVTFTGTGLNQVQSVSFGGSGQISISANAGGTQLTAAVPSGASSGNVVLNFPGGSITAGTFTVTAQNFTSYNVIYGGNSNVEDRGDCFPDRTASFLAGEGDYTHYNGGSGGKGIDWMLENFQLHVGSRMVAGRGNIVVGMEGTNSMGGNIGQAMWNKTTQTLTASGVAYCDSVKQWIQQCYDAGAYKVFWISTLPKTTVSGWSAGWDQEGRLHKATNAKLAAEVGSIGPDGRKATYIDLDNGKSLIGAQGTADFGQDAGYSSYAELLTANAPAGYEATGYLANTNYFYSEDGGVRYMLVHLNGNGFNVLGRIVADYILSLTKGTALPNRSQYGAPAPPVNTEQEVDWVNIAGNIVTYNPTTKRVGVSGNESFGAGANSSKALAAPGKLKVRAGNSGSQMVGLNNQASGVSFTDMRYALFFEDTAYSKWSMGANLGKLRSGVTRGVGAVELTFDVQVDKVDVYLDNETTPLGTWDGAVTFPIWIDCSLSITSNYVEAPRIDGPSAVNTPT
ncbi:Ig-like domain-containing protein [Solirubrum puertoriconensis]|uniref:IPT/TIG domain-containing protein n=1 Tax=Solirubrum puertoriconensis TaxID=1751427 RepID=A0A9X0L3U8_SOLP1|nr:Ig-like domain-containing protein [Solirubrum puertoriconensis]KUG06877.1 hypothetical protein ASU33_06010 [Solirubrum puertoriconensis]